MVWSPNGNNFDFAVRKHVACDRSVRALIRPRILLQLDFAAGLSGQSFRIVGGSRPAYGVSFGHVTDPRGSLREDGGEGGIRTHGTRKGSTVFKTAAIDHSATSPRSIKLTALADASSPLGGRGCPRSDKVQRTMNIRAAILWEPGTPLSVEEAELAPPQAAEVLVEVKAAGVCHSDLHAFNGDWPMRLPLIPGHEGAGVIREVGANVSRLKVGDRVVLCWAPPCGQCPPCVEGRPILCDRLEKTTFRNKLPDGTTRIRARGNDVAAFLGTACFASHVVVPESGAIAIDDDTPFESLAALGCAVLTGVGAVMNAARIAEGSTVAVIGAGGVGLNVIQGAVIAGASRIIAADRNDAALQLAQQLGATDIVRVERTAAEAIRQCTHGRGAQYVFDTVGTPDTLADALQAARKGGNVIVTGLSRVDGRGSIAMFPFVMQEKRLIGSAYGSGDPLRDIPQLVAFHRAGKLKLQEIATRSYSLDQVNDALSALAAAQPGRGIIRF